MLKDLITQPEKEPRAVDDLLKNIILIDQQQRQELDLVREAEKNYSLQDATDTCSENVNSENTPIKDEVSSCVENENSNTSTLGYQITGNEIIPKTVSDPSANVSQEEQDDLEPAQDLAGEYEESAVDWEDLTREQWSETDRLLQKIERVGTRVLQHDFLSSIGETLSG